MEQTQAKALYKSSMQELTPGFLRSFIWSYLYAVFGLLNLSFETAILLR
jgi:hypothetical protein